VDGAYSLGDGGSARVVHMPGPNTPRPRDWAQTSSSLREPALVVCVAFAREPPGRIGLRTGLLSISLQRGSSKALSIGRAQLLARETYEEFYATFGNIVGGPLSPLLSTLLLDQFDREVEKRGHRFVRSADDANLYVKSERGNGGWRV